jgi:prepilin-type processing-associated H-X9-DG protein/prepilin-type N-terminal cleavage/methylation domain-containing protein
MRRRAQKLDSPTGFTVIEVLVVVAIIGLMVALLLPAVNAAREAARRAQCVNNLKQMGLAMHSFHGTTGKFPAGYSVKGLPPQDDGMTPGFGWGVFLLGSLEQQSLYNSFNFDLWLVQPEQKTALSVRLSVYTCPSSESPTSDPYNQAIMISDRLPVSHYVASAGQFQPYSRSDSRPTRIVGVGSGVFYLNSRTSAPEITDGLSQTLMVGERSRNVASATWIGVPAFNVPLCTNGTWPIRSCDSDMYLVFGRTGGPLWNGPDSVWFFHTPNSLTMGVDGFASRHPGGCNFLFCDGSVRFIKDQVQQSVFNALATRNGGEAVSGDQF